MALGRTLAALSVVLFCQPVWAQSAEDILGEMKEAYDRLRDAEVRFVQHVHLPVAGIEQEARGMLFFRKPNHYRVETGDRTIVTDGTTVWSYSAATRQVLIDNFAAEQGMMTPERLLLGAPGGYSASIVKRERLGGAAVVVLKLVPTDPNAVLAGIKLWVHTGDWLVRQAELDDGSGRVTTYRVETIKVNTAIPDTRFTFQVPEGAEAVDLR